MHNLAIRRTSELPPADRRVVEAMLGRRLADNEEVGVWASLPHEAPAGPERIDAWQNLNRHLDSMAAKAEGNDVGDLERLVDEVSDEVRHGRG